MNPEDRLARALRAQAVGGRPVNPAPPRRAALSGGVILVIALALGLLCGAVAGLVTVL